MNRDIPDDPNVSVEAVHDLTLGPLARDDLDAVVAIDRPGAGRSRRGFFERRLGLAEQAPDAFITVAARARGSLVGFVVASVLEGEFGHAAPVAILEALGVAPEWQHRNVARALLRALAEHLGQRDIAELHTQVRWTDRALTGFFQASGFELAPRLVLERATGAPADC